MTIGDRLREERKRLALSQPGFAEVALTTKQTVFSWETGKTAPDAVQLSALATAGVDVLYVVTGQRPATHSALANLHTATKVAERTTGTRAEQAEVQAAVFEQMQALPPRIRALVENYQAAPEEGKRVIEGTATLASKVTKKSKAA